MWVTLRDVHSNTITPTLGLLAVHLRLASIQADPYLKKDGTAFADVAMSLDWVGDTSFCFRWAMGMVASDH
jgi:hypothetical protein